MGDLFQYLPEDKKSVLRELKDRLQNIISGRYDFSAAKPKELKGHRLLPLIEPETVQAGCNMMPEETVFVVSFPKAGTNWMFEIVRHIIFGADEEMLALSKLMPATLSSIHVWKPEKYDLLPYIPLARRLLASHMPEELMNVENIKQKKGKIILVVRNPKDQAVSWFHFSKNRWFDSIRDELSTDWPQFLSDYMQGKHPMNSRPGEWYVDYLSGWSKHMGSDHVLFVGFERMKKDPSSEIRRIAEFLKVQLTDEQVHAVVCATSYETMRKQQSSESSEVDKLRNAMEVVRKGQVGSWKETFTVAQSEMMDVIIKEKLGQSGIELVFE